MVTRLVDKLLRALNRVWDRKPGFFPAIRLTCDGIALSWAISGRTLTTAPTGGTAAPLSIPLDGLTIGKLCGLLGSQTGYKAVLLAGPSSGFAAFSLPDQSGGSSVPGGSVIRGASNPNWLYMDAVGSELEIAQAQIDAMLSETVTSTADGEWLDFLGGFFKVPREPGEADQAYGPRIIAEVTRPRCNNKAIEAILEAALGQAATVEDVVLYGNAKPQYDGEILHDGSYLYDTALGSPIYNLFDVVTNFDIINGTSLPVWQASVAAIVERLRAAGTQMRALALSGSALTDIAASPSDNSVFWPETTLGQDEIITSTLSGLTTDTGIPIAAVEPNAGGTWSSMLVGTETVADALVPPGDSMTGRCATQISDVLPLPTDSGALEWLDQSTYDGQRLYDGSRYYSSGVTVTEPLGA